MIELAATSLLHAKYGFSSDSQASKATKTVCCKLIRHLQVGTISRSKGALKSKGVRRSNGKSASSKVRRPSIEGRFFEIYIF